MPRKQRLDILLAERGLFASRTRAAASVMAGEVSVGAERRTAGKPGEMVAIDVELSVREPPKYVSRGGTKLANALDRLALEVTGRRAIDLGASTGGFTDCLLQRGADEVIAVDVGYGDLHYRLRTDRRVRVLERTNARSLTSEMLPYAPDLAVIDVSFISLTKVLPALLACMSPRFDALAMVKPQFEVGRERVGKGGVVRSAEDRRRALVDVAMAARAQGAAVLGYASSGLPGPKGNLETFAWLTEASRAAATTGTGAGVAGDRDELERMAREVEP
ncbi:MAG TPA: TlyA family RNA methyltransferase [Solirubrobacteraceae bacterium]|nr:TlyA family RNA methyltransferase [Solirubrobacteraceae bacterium]